MNVQRVNLSHQTFGDYSIGNGACSNDSKGQVSGTFTIKGPNAPTAPTNVTKFVLGTDGTAHIELGTDGRNTIDAKGTYQSADGTDRLVSPVITAMTIAGNAVVPPQS